ncbi:MAG: selenocysteine-specific translation elongation factor, partial [Gemmatimonadota bacterium]
IDLGFAFLPLPGFSEPVAIVDVPGHEAFVRNMVAGATGIDVALLVVAADEGVMPQTEEHLAILEFLGVRTGVVAITKVDLAAPDWLELVEADLTERLAASPIAWEPAVRFSAVSGAGAEDLMRALATAAARAVERSTDDLFRMPVDRVFSVAGAGTVVTGTTWSGSVVVGGEVRVLPGDARSVVRSVEVHGEARAGAEPGRRTALALRSVEKADLARGAVVVADPAWRESWAVDAIVTLLDSAPRPLTQRSRVRLHMGTAEILARVTPGAGEIAPGEAGAVRFRLERPLVARWGDRGVVRSYSPMHTIGGCVVVDPWPPPRPRRPVELEARTAADPVARVRALVALEGKRGVGVADLPIRLGIHPATVDRVVNEVTTLGVLNIEGRLLPQVVVEASRRRLEQALEGYHEEHPLEPGMPRELLRAALDLPDLAEHLEENLAHEGWIVLEGGTVRLASYQPTLSARQREWSERIGTALAAAGYQGQSAQELGEHVPPAEAVPLAEYLVRQGTAARVGRERYYDRAALERLRDEIVEEVGRLGRASPAELRVRTGLTRKYLIPVLEWLDGAGFTARDGDARRLGPAAGGGGPA